MNLQDWAAVATVAGAVVSAATLGFAWWIAMKQLPKELEHFRATKLEERRAEVAERLWLAVTRYEELLRRLLVTQGLDPYPNVKTLGRDFDPVDLFRSTFADALARLERARSDLAEARAVAEVYLGDVARIQMHDLFAFRERAVRCHISRLLDVRRGADLETNKEYFWLSNGQGQQELETLVGQIRSVLLPVARLGHSAPPEEFTPRSE